MGEPHSGALGWELLKDRTSWGAQHTAEAWLL